MPLLALVVAATLTAHAASVGRGPAHVQGACSLDEVVLLQGAAAVQGRAQSASGDPAVPSQGFLSQGVNLLIQNLDEYTDEATLRELFAPFGSITSVALPQTEQGRGQGYGFVTFASQDSATRAISEMHLKVVNGQSLHVGLLAKPTEPPKVLHVPSPVQKVHKKQDIIKKPPHVSFRDHLSSLWHRLGVIGGDFGSHVFFPEDDEGTQTLPGNFPNRSDRRFDSRAELMGRPRIKHKVGVRRQWAVVKQHSYCANHRKAVTGTTGPMRVPRCQELAVQDGECGDTVYSNGETDCYCVLAGYECELKPSTRANSVFQRLLPLASEEYESTLLHRWSHMRKKRRAALANFNFTTGKDPTVNASNTSAAEEDEAPPGMKLIAMPPGLASRLQTVSIIFFLTLPAIMASWCVTSVGVK